jgi:hypothetical protein
VYFEGQGWVPIDNAPRPDIRLLFDEGGGSGPSLAGGLGEKAFQAVQVRIAARVSLQKMPNPKHAHRNHQKPKHLALRNGLVELRDNRQQGDGQSNELQEAGHRVHALHATIRRAFRQAVGWHALRSADTMKRQAAHRSQ